MGPDGAKIYVWRDAGLNGDGERVATAADRAAVVIQPVQCQEAMVPAEDRRVAVVDSLPEVTSARVGWQQAMIRQEGSDRW